MILDGELGLLIMYKHCGKRPHSPAQALVVINARCLCTIASVGDWGADWPYDCDFQGDLRLIRQ